MQNRELKAELIKSGEYGVFCVKKYQAFKEGQDIYFADYGSLSSDKLSACFQLSDAKRKQRHKVEEWCDFYVNDWLPMHKGYSLVFVTITWNNETLSLKADTRRKLVNTLLSNHTVDYVSNIDFGSQGEREHYHAVAILDDSQVNLSTQSTNKKGNVRLSGVSGFDDHREKYGYICIEPVDLSTTRQVSCYLAKLVNHSLKVKQSRLGIKKVGTPYRLWLNTQNTARRHEKRWNKPKGTWTDPPTEDTILRAL